MCIRDRFSNVPIIFISSASDKMNIVMAVNMGGDDFISKPFDLSVQMCIRDRARNRQGLFFDANL